MKDRNVGSVDPAAGKPCRSAAVHAERDWRRNIAPVPYAASVGLVAEVSRHSGSSRSWMVSYEGDEQWEMAGN